MAGDSKNTRNKSTITEKLVTYFLFLNITAVLIVGLLSHINSKQAINQRTFEQLNSVKFAKKRQVESFFRDRMNEVRFISGMDHTIHAVNMLKDGKLGSGGPGAINRDNTLNKVFLNFPYYKNIVIKSANGREFVIRPENKPGNIKEGYKIPGKLPDIIKVNGPDTRIFEVSDTSTSDNNSLYLAANIIDYTGDTAGMIVFGLDRDIINSFMLETNPREGLGKSGESYIIGSDMMMRTKSRFYRDTMYSLPVKTNGAYEAVRGRFGTAIYRDYRHMEVLGSYGPLDIPGLKWYMLAEIDLEESDQPIIANRNNILVLTLIIAGIVFLITYFLARRLTVPIIRLTEATKRIARGNFNESVELLSNDEIGELTSTFNNMAGTLKRQEEEIEKERQKRAQAAIEALEKERIRLSRELHDGLGQTLISQKLKLENIDPANINKAAALLDDVKNSIDSTINEVRHICNDLMPAVLFEFGLVNAIRKLCRDLNDFSSMEIVFKSDFSNEPLSEKTRIYLFRITQESLKNAIQHSEGTLCEVSLSGRASDLLLRISDNGKGFDTRVMQEGNGLINIRERANLLNGRLSICSAPGGGTELTIRINSSANKVKNYG